jgi:hypothetical protein
VAGDDVDGSASTIFRLAMKTYVHTPVTVSSSPSSRREQCGWIGEEQGCGGERAVKVSGVSGGGGGENARVVYPSSQEPNMNDAHNCV